MGARGGAVREGLDGPRPARAEDLPSILELCDAVFRGPGQGGGAHGGQMGRDFPLLFSLANAARLRVWSHEGRVVAHAGYRRVEAVLDGVGVPLALLGAVATAEPWRGHGLATALLADAWAAMRGDGVALVSISGWRRLYARAGAVRGGRCRRFRVSRPAAERLARAAAAARTAGVGDLSVREVGTGDVACLARLHSGEAVRVRRSVAEFGLLLDAGAAAASGGERQVALLVEGAGRPLGYLVLAVHPHAGSAGGPTRRRSARVVESAGERAALAGILAAVLDRLGVERLALPVLEGDGGWERLLAAAGLVAAAGPFPETSVAVVDPTALAPLAAPYWSRHAGGAAAGWRLEADGGGWSLTGPGVMRRWATVQEISAAVAAAPLADGPPALPVPWIRGLDFT